MKINNNPIHEISIDYLYKKYISNPISEVIIIGGLEPILQYKEVIDLIDHFRNNGCNDYFVIYTGYYENEIEDIINLLKQRKNIIVKFGRFIPNSKEKYDEVLGVTLSSYNQYGKVIS
jgi:pyruvate-formate lyase-activating enzyme